MHYIVYKSPAGAARHHVTSSDAVAKQPQSQQQQEPMLVTSRHRHQHHSAAMTSLSTTSDVTHQFTDVLRSRGTHVWQQQYLYWRSGGGRV